MKKNVASVCRSYLLIILFVAVSSSYGQERNPPQRVAEDDVVRVSTNLVTVPVSVMDRQGRFIPDLKEEQFHIYEDGIEQVLPMRAPCASPRNWTRWFIRFSTTLLQT